MTPSKPSRMEISALPFSNSLRIKPSQFWFSVLRKSGNIDRLNHRNIHSRKEQNRQCSKYCRQPRYLFPLSPILFPEQIAAMALNYRRELGHANLKLSKERRQFFFFKINRHIVNAFDVRRGNDVLRYGTLHINGDFFFALFVKPDADRGAMMNIRLHAVANSSLASILSRLGFHLAERSRRSADKKPG